MAINREEQILTTVELVCLLITGAASIATLVFSAAAVVEANEASCLNRITQDMYAGEKMSGAEYARRKAACE